MPGWVPRRPSGRIFERLFDHRTSANGRDSSVTRELFHWVVPVAGCVLLVFGTLPGRWNQPIELSTEATNGLFAGVSSSARRLDLRQSELRHSGLNNVPQKTLQWTMSSDHPSIIPNLIYTATNFLNR